MTEIPIDEIALVPTASTSHNNTGREGVQVVVRQGDCASRRKHLLTKIRRFPFCYILVLALGILLLLSILSCILYETYRNGTLNFEHELVEHNIDDREYHMKIVNEVNSNQKSTWKAKYNRFASRSQENNSEDLGEVSKLLTKKQNLSDEALLQDTKEHLESLIKAPLNLPKSFDSRLQWPKCATIHEAPNQGGCGSCWSVSAASTMSDRLCIATNGSVQEQLSAQDLTSCCHNCGGCQGTHWAHSSFVYWKEHGIVTGGDYGSWEGCRPYEMPPNCGSPCSSSTYTKKRTPSCSQTCQSLYGKSYYDDLFKSRKAYWIWAERGGSEMTPIIHETIHSILKSESGTDIIKREIFLNGPILACFTLYEDFQHYDSGIYKPNRLKSKELYGHCAKLIGWGEEAGVQYWTYMNTWGRNWGEYGFFRIDQSEVPEEAVAGLL